MLNIIYGIQMDKEFFDGDIDTKILDDFYTSKDFILDELKSKDYTYSSSKDVWYKKGDLYTTVISIVEKKLYENEFHSFL